MQTYIFFANCATLNAKKMTTQFFFGKIIILASHTLS